MPALAETIRVKRRGIWQHTPGADPPFEYHSIAVEGPRSVAWCRSHQAWFDPAEAAIGQPCPAQKPGECNSILVKRVGHICLECEERPLLRRGQLRQHISAFHRP